MKVWRELQLAGLQISSTETPFSKAQEDETPRVECACNFSRGSKDKLLEDNTIASTIQRERLGFDRGLPFARAPKPTNSYSDCLKALVRSAYQRRARTGQSLFKRSSSADAKGGGEKTANSITEWGCHNFRCVSSIRSHNHSVTSDRELKARWADGQSLHVTNADVNASNSAVFKETKFMSTISRGSNGGPVRARNTTS